MGKNKKKNPKQSKRKRKEAIAEQMRLARDAIANAPEEQPLGMPRLRVRLSCEGVAVLQHTLVCDFRLVIIVSAAVC